MKFYGYIKEYMNCSFTIPIYSDGKDYFFHKLNEGFTIEFFEKTEKNDFIIPCSKNLKVKEGDFGLVVFIGLDEFKEIGPPKKSLKKIAKYLDSLPTLRQYISHELFDLAKKLTINLELLRTKYKIKLLLKKDSQNKEKIEKIMCLIINLRVEYLRERSRKESYKHLKKQGQHKHANTEKINSLINGINDEIKNKNYSRALNELENLLIYQHTVSPIKYIIKSLSNLSYDAHNIGDLTFSFLLIYFAKLLPINDPVVNNQFAEIFKTAGNLIEAKQIYLETQKKFLNNVVAKSGYAEILKTEGNLTEAKQIYLDIHKKFPHDVVAKNGYADILKAEGNFEQAKLIYLAVQEKFPNDVFAKTGFAEILKAEGNFEQAKLYYLDIQKQFPDDVVTKNGYAGILKAEGNLNEAKHTYLEIQKKFPHDVVAKAGLAEILKAEGKFEQAKLIYLGIQKKFPNNVVAKNGYAEILKAEGNLEGAKLIYLDVQKQFPNNVVAKNGFAEILKAEGNVKEAKQVYLDIQKKFPKDLYVKHGILTCQILLNDLENIDLELNLKEIPKTISDFYFYHSNIMIQITRGHFELAQNLIIKVLDDIPYFETRRVYKNTLNLVRMYQNEYEKLYRELLKEPTSSFSIGEIVLNTHICAEVKNIQKAKSYLENIKTYPKNSIYHEGACILSELFNLNGLPKKNLNSEELKKMLLEIEIKCLVCN